MRGAVSRQEASAEAVEQLKRGVRHGADLVGRAASTAQEMTARGAERLQDVWEPEDPGEILASSPLFRPLHVDVLPSDPRMLSVQWRSDVLLGLSAAGVLSLEDEIIGLTRRLFHDDLPTRQLSERLFDRDLSSLHAWIDTVPGAAGPGGGVTHRVAHGHDLEAAAAVYEEYGLVGVLAWTQHMAQDAFTPTGVPLPVGAKNVAGWLVDEGHASPGHAALLVSFNAAELAASFLAGVFVLRLAMMLRQIQRRRKVRRRCAAAADARERGDVDAVIANYSEALALSDGDPTISLALGWAYRQIGRPAADSFLAFRRAATALATRDRLLEMRGVTFSLRGLAYLLALVEAQQLLEREDLRGAWRNELERVVSGALSSFEVAAISQIERPALRIGEREVAWRPRPLSAAANYYLAARTAASVPFVVSSGEVTRLIERATSVLRASAPKLAGEHRETLRAIERRWILELARP